jgi:thiol-disulfide isomerase/thioredoxin
VTTINLGPLSFPVVLLVGVLAVFAAIWAGSRIERRIQESKIVWGIRRDPVGTASAKRAPTTLAWDQPRPKKSTEAILWRMLIVGVIAGRLGFVASQIEGYAAQPWSFADLRDGGFSIEAGLACAAMVALWYLWTLPARRRPLSLALLAGASVFSAGAGVASLFQSPPALLPDALFTSLDGGAVALSDFHGKPTVVNLWATWCPPCQREMPALRDGQLNNPDVHFVFANQGEAHEAVKDYLERHRLDLQNVWLDPTGQLNQQIKGRGLPTTLFLDAKGQLADVRLGELSTATLQSRLDDLRAGKSSLLRLSN